MPTKPDHVKEELSKFSRNKLPHFFKYAKDKEDNQVNGLDKDNKWENSTVNKLEYMIPDKPIRFKSVAGDFDYRVLMKNQYIHNNEELVKTFDKINKKKHFLMTKENLNDFGFNLYLQNELSNIVQDAYDVVDILVKHYFVRDSKFKETIWSAFGDIIHQNLIHNLGDTVQCDNCIERFKAKNNELLCTNCKKESMKISWRESKRKTRVQKAKTI